MYMNLDIEDFDWGQGESGIKKKVANFDFENNLEKSLLKCLFQYQANRRKAHKELLFFLELRHMKTYFSWVVDASILWS